MKSIKLILAIAVLALFTGCANDDHYGTPDLSVNCEELTVTKEVSDIVATSTMQQYIGNDVIEAYVTSSDMGGNFYKSISFVSLDNSKGFSMPIDDYNLYTKFPPGQKVYIKLDSLLYVQRRSSQTRGIQIGTAYQGNVGRIASVLYRDIIIPACEGSVNEDEIVNNITIEQAKNEDYLNMLIEFDAVQFTDASVGAKYFDESLPTIGGSTNHKIEDNEGNDIIVRISQYSNFASNPVAEGSGKIRGVLTRYGSDYQFMVRNERDIQLANPRFPVLFSESFTDGFDHWFRKSVTGAQVWTLNTTNGNPGNCADMNGFSGGAVANEDWLISPAIDLSDVPTAILSFQTAKNFTGNALQVYVSTDYVDDAMPSTATWTLLSATMATASNFAWTNSGNVSLNSYVGNNNVRIAFKYTSTSSAAAQWRVDNIKVK